MNNRQLYAISDFFEISDEDGDASSHSGSDEYYDYAGIDKNVKFPGEDDIEFPKLIPLRASTAPARPLTELEEFKRSSDFLLLENTVMLSNN